VERETKIGLSLGEGGF